MSFAEELTKVVAAKRCESREHEELAERWHAQEAKLCEELMNAFKDRCLREAEQLRNTASISFATLCRDVASVPRHTVNDSNAYLVKDWGECSAECWFYARHGANATWSPGLPILYAELLESMMPKFLERLHSLGFDSLNRESGTWKVTAAWGGQGGAAAKTAPAAAPTNGANGKAANGSVTNGATNGNARDGETKRNGKRGRSPTPTPTEGAPTEGAPTEAGSDT